MASSVLSILKNGVVFFIGGVILALMSPYLGALIGLAPDSASAARELGKMGDPLLAGGAGAVLGLLDGFLKRKSPSAPGDKKFLQ